PGKPAIGPSYLQTKLHVPVPRFRIYTSNDKLTLNSQFRQRGKHVFVAGGPATFNHLRIERPIGNADPVDWTSEQALQLASGSFHFPSNIVRRNLCQHRVGDGLRSENNPPGELPELLGRQQVLLGEFV